MPWVHQSTILPVNSAEKGGLASPAAPESPTVSCLEETADQEQISSILGHQHHTFGKTEPGDDKNLTSAGVSQSCFLRDVSKHHSGRNHCEAASRKSQIPFSLWGPCPEPCHSMGQGKSLLASSPGPVSWAWDEGLWRGLRTLNSADRRTGGQTDTSWQRHRGEGHGQRGQ